MGERKKVALLGAAGRMGQRIAELLERDANLFLYAQLISSLGTQDKPNTFACVNDAIKDADVVIDFSVAKQVERHIDACIALKKPLLVGVTGLPEQAVMAAKRAAQSIPIMIAPNTSVSIALIKRLCDGLSTHMAPPLTVRITDKHHTAKRDSPSGTALTLAQTIHSTLNPGLPFLPAIDSKRDRPGQIEIWSTREGEVVGDHQISFSNAYEEVTVAHHAIHRDLFAAGALQAASWLMIQKFGFYEIDHVIKKDI